MLFNDQQIGMIDLVRCSFQMYILLENIKKYWWYLKF